MLFLIHNEVITPTTLYGFLSSDCCTCNVNGGTFRWQTTLLTTVTMITFTCPFIYQVIAISFNFPRSHNEVFKNAHSGRADARH